MEDIRKKKWIEDIEMLEVELPKRHKNLFFNIEEEEFYNKVKELKDNLQYFDDYEIYIEIAKIVAAIGDAHTFITLPVRLLCPFELYWFPDGIYVTSTIPEYEELMYKRITHINHLEIEEVINRFTLIISHENKSFLRSQLPKYLPAVEILYGLEIVDDFDTVTFTFEDREKNKKIVEIKPFTIKEAREKLKVNRKEESLPLYRKDPHKYYWFQYIDNHKTLYFKYNVCRESLEGTLYDLCSDMMEIIDKGHVEKVVIDMRNNFGGNSTLLDPFIEYLKNCKKINNRGQLFVIVGRETFSSALLNTLALRENTKGIFLGENSGGKPNCYGEVERFNLKNSGLTIGYSTKYYKVVEDDDLLEFSPEVKIDLTIEDYIKNEDPCMDYILRSSFR